MVDNPFSFVDLVKIKKIELLVAIGVMKMVWQQSQEELQHFVAFKLSDKFVEKLAKEFVESK